MTDQFFLDRHITFHSHDGTLSFTLTSAEGRREARTLIREATAAVHYQLSGAHLRLALAGPGLSFGVGQNLVTFSHQDRHVRLDWNWATVGGALESWLEVTNHGRAPISLQQLDVLCLSGTASLDLPGPVSEWRVFQNGWQSWSPTGVRRLGSGPFPALPHDEYRLKHLPHGDGSPEGKLRSEWVTLISAAAEQVETSSETASDAPAVDSAHLLFGFVTGADQLAEVILQADDQFQSLTATCHTDGITLAPGESLRSERLRVATGPDGWGSLEAWAERMSKLMQARVPEQTPTGWCTWYYYFGLNTAQDVYTNLNAIRRHHLPLNLVMIDDGYQTAIGDWLTLNRERFSDMAPVTATIRREGRVAGIWTAPFGLAANSQTWASHPNWVVRDDVDEPVFAWNHLGQPIYALDTTHPEVADWLHATFRAMRQEWGYEAFKVDFLFAAALPGRRHDPKATRAQALRRGLEIIRDAIGNDAFLLGCGAPLCPAVGLVDGMRIGPDVSPAWEPIPTDSSFPEKSSDLSAPSTANALRNNIARAFTHGRLWAADPDCLLARPRGDSSQLTLYEVRTLAVILALTGGMVLDSDLVRDLPPSRLTMLRQMLPPTDQVAYPLDLFEHDMPEILILPIERPWGRWWLVGLVNWDNLSRITTVEPPALGLPPGRYYVYDQWRADYLGQTDGAALTLPRQRPHETTLLLFKPITDRPDWLTSTFHLTAGSVEVVDVIRQRLGERRQKLVVHVEKPGENFGRLVFTAPQDWVVLDAQVNGRRRSVNVRNREVGVVDMGFTLRDRAWVLVDFARSKI
jgi:alpha-galactosidase